MKTGTLGADWEVTVKVIPLKGTNPPVNPNPKPEPEPEKPVTKYFKDVPNSHWASININEMHKRGIINGYTDGTFRPNQPISRVHVASLFARSMDLEPIREGKEFKDVSKGHVYYNDIQKVYRAGIFDGNLDGTFGVENNLTRAQMAKVIVNAFDLTPNIYEGSVFPDVSQNHWARYYINTLYMSEITVGSDGKYLPNNNVTRAHYAAFLHRALEQEEK